MNPRLRIPLIIIGVITIIVIAIFVLPRGLSLYYQIRGGQQIEYVLRFEEGIQELVCEPLSPANEEARKEVENGIDDLTRSIRLNKNNAQAYYYIGKAHCLLGDPSKARDHFLEYTRLRPENPLGHLGLGFANDAICREDSNGGFSRQVVCADEEMKTLIVEEWEKAGVDVGKFIAEGNAAFRVENYEIANIWYQRAAAYSNSDNNSPMFMWSVAAVLSGNPLPLHESSLIPVYQIEENTLIQAEELRWLREDSRWNLNYGDRLIDVPPQYSGAGVMWWSGTAIVIINVQEEGIYKITLSAMDTPPGPIKLQIERDMVPIDQLIWDKGDKRWYSLSAVTNMTAGTHILGVNYLEDNGDAIIDWIRLERLK